MTKELRKYRDGELVLELTKGEQKAERAFTEIYSRYSQKFYAYCLRLTGHEEDAQDLFQETFLRFCDLAKNEMKYIDHILSMLITVARNLYINTKRNLKNTVNLDEFELITYEDNYDQKELLELIARAIELLEFEHREVFILRQYQGLSYSEISKITGESVSTVRNRAWRSKEKLKEILAPYLVEL